MLAIKKQRLALRDEHVYPLCEETPEKINIQDNNGNRDELSKIPDGHIARDIKDLSFMSPPALDDESKDEVDPKAEFLAQALLSGLDSYSTSQAIRG